MSKEWIEEIKEAFQGHCEVANVSCAILLLYASVSLYVFKKRFCYKLRHLFRMFPSMLMDIQAR